LPAIWPPYIHTFDWITLVNQVRCFNNKRIPFIEVFNFRRYSAFCLGRAFAHIVDSGDYHS
ncbi:MAG TPA: hypothetical protein D7H84_01390, partial [Candidatus Poseidoniales archaeon]